MLHYSLVISNRGSIYNLAKYYRINQQDLSLLLQKRLFEGDLLLKIHYNKKNKNKNKKGGE